MWRVRMEGGSVDVLYATSAGLSVYGGQHWNQGSPGILGNPEYLDIFGHSVGAGDFSGDGAADLAVGVPLEDLFGFVDAGLVNVLYGSRTAGGLSSSGNQLLYQGLLGGSSLAGEEFGVGLSSR